MSIKINKRLLKNNLKKWLKRPEIIVIVGPRQAGKTFFVKNLLPGITSREVKYFNFESLDLRELWQNNPNNFLKNIIEEKEPIYVFDEFQKVPDLASRLKVLYDEDKQNFPKIILTGSSLPEIKDKVSQSLVGQAVVFNMLTLSFREKYFLPEIDFLQKTFDEPEKIDIKSIEKKTFLQKKEIKSKLLEYLLEGGYPELGEFKKEQRSEKLKSIIQLVLERDLQQLVKSEHLFSSKKLLEMLSFQIGNLVSFENMASEMQLNNKTIRRLVAILEGLFLIKLVYPKSSSAHEYKKAPKIYFHDLGFRNELIKVRQLPLESAMMGGLVENFIFNQLSRYGNYKNDFKINYWQNYNKNEVDFILSRGEKLVSVEVKYRRGQKSRLTKGIISFIQRYKPQCHIVATFDYFHKTKVDNCPVYFIPAYAFGFIV